MPIKEDYTNLIPINLVRVRIRQRMFKIVQVPYYLEQNFLVSPTVQFMVWFRGVQRSKAFWFTTWCFFFLMLTFSFSAGVRHFFLYFFMHVGVTLGAVQKLRWQIFGFFWPPNPLRWQFLPDKSWHFWTIYPFLFENVVCERSLKMISYQYFYW